MVVAITNEQLAEWEVWVAVHKHADEPTVRALIREVRGLRFERDRYRDLAGYARHDGGCPAAPFEDEASCPCGYLRARAALNRQGKP